MKHNFGSTNEEGEHFALPICQTAHEVPDSWLTPRMAARKGCRNDKARVGSTGRVNDARWQIWKVSPLLHTRSYHNT